MPKVKVCVLRAAGTNCDKETAFAFEQAGACAEFMHINRLIRGSRCLADYQILAIPGGFTYGDDIAAGKILANELKCCLAEELKDFIKKGKLIIGICNGFQVLVKAGLLPGNVEFRQEASLIINDCAKFEDRWVYLKSKVKSKKSKVKCVWTKDLPEIIYLPIAHGEGKFIAQDKEVLQGLKRNQQIVFQYCDPNAKLSGYPHNPNGSQENIAGICDETGRILGLMPHPERYIYFTQHPRWAGDKLRQKSWRTRQSLRREKGYGDGLQIFRNGIAYAKSV